MPDVRMPDGTIIKNVPAGITKAQLNAKLTKNGFSLAELTTPKQKPSAIENIPLVGGLIAPIADIPLSVVEGLSGTTKSIADVFGADNAVSDAADYVSKAAAALKSAGSREDAEIASKIQKDAEGKGVWEEVKAAAKAFTYSPLESIASVAGSAIPFVAAGVATGGTGVVPVATMAGLGAVSGAGTVKGAIYDAVYDEFTKNGASEKDAEAAAEKAQEYGGKNTDQTAIGGVVGALASATGFPAQFARSIGKNAAARAAAEIAKREAAVAAGEAVKVGARKSVLGGTAKSAVVEAVPEAVQGGQEKLAQNLALQREGFDVDTWKGVAGQAASEGIASLFLGGYGGAREARAENRQMLTKEIAQELDTLPADADEEVVSEAVNRFIKRGFSLEKATQVVENLKAAKEAIDKQAAEIERARAERQAQADADAEAEAVAQEGTGSNFTGPPPVDTEEEAAMQRMREAEFGPKVKSDINAQIDEYTSFVAKGQAAPAPLVESIARQYVGAMQGAGVKGFVSPDRMDAFSQFIGNELDTVNQFVDEAAESAIPEAVGAGMGYSSKTASTPAPQRGVKQPTVVTPARAYTILNNPDTAGNYNTVSDFAATTGMDTREAESVLDDIANEVPGAPVIKYSRRGRPPSASTVEAAGQEGLFDALPAQEENRLDKFEEIQQRKLEQGALAPEDREAERQARADEFDALQQERAAKDEQYTAEFVKGVEGKLQSANPANTAYSVQLDTASPKPYRIVGPDGELFAASDNLQDFEAQAARLDPYTAPPTPIQDTDSANPTVATSMVQELTREVDAARERGEIDNNQRTELIRRLERPDAYDKYGRPQDNIAKAEEEARAAMSKFRNATGVEAKAAEAELAVANEKLTKLVNNRMLNPIRATLRSMVENRQLEREGATSRVGSAKVQQKLGEMEGADTSAEQREQREAKIDLAESRVSKYRRGEAQPGQVKADVSKVRAAVDAIVSVWKGPPIVTVVQSVNDIADAKVRRAVMQDNATYAEGFVVPDGTVYLIADNLESVERAKAVLFHEALGHIGLERLFRGELDSVLAALYKSNGNIRNKTDAWLVANPKAYPKDKNQIARAVEEVLAEMSENGQLRPTMIKRIAAIIRNYARKLGFNLAISDADVEAILAAGHERVVSGAQESTLVKGMRYINSERPIKYSRSKATPEERKKVENAAARLSAGARRVKDTTSVYGMVDGIEEAADSAPILRDTTAFEEATSSILRGLALKSMPSSGITNWLERKSPAVYKKVEILVDRVRKMNGLRVSLKDAGQDLVRDMEDFVREYGSDALASAQFINRINEVDFLAFKTVDEALAKHRAIKAIEDELLSNSNNKAETRKFIDAIKEQALNATDNTTVLKSKVKLSTPILAHMNSLTKVAIANDKVLLKVKQLAAMTQRIRDSYAAKEELAKQKGGLKLYKDEREYHKDMFEARQALLDERIARGQGEEAMVRIRDMRAKMMREMQSPSERQKKGDIFWDLDADLFDKEYFPALRDGQYWLRVEEDLSKGREEGFYVFESVYERERAKRELGKRLKENFDDNNVFKEGNDIGDLQNTLRETDDLMQRVFDIVGKARKEYEDSGQADMVGLVDSIYQTWLMTTDERSARRHHMHAKLIAGFSTNTLANLQRSVASNANELTKLAYAGQVRLDIKEIKDIIGDKERPLSEQTMLDDFARELEKRAEQEINPGAHNAIVNFINRSSFYYYLTSARTALTNFANIPMRVIPRFWREYGYVEGTAMWMKYMKMWDSLGRVKMERTKMRFGDHVDAIMPNVNGSNFVKNSADLQWAMKAGTERGILMTVVDTMVSSERGTAYRSQSNLTGSIQDLRANVGKVMGFLFTGTENISRQATFYMAFELEMNKQKKENPTKPLEARREAALQKAMRITDDTIGNFADWERPSIAKGEIARGFFLFKMHPILQTKYMTGAFRDIIGAPLRGVARQVTGKGKLTAEDTAYVAGALKEFSGVLMMAGLLGGVGALPFYTMMAHALAEGFDDEDDDDVRKLLGMDPRTAYDADIMFRRWLMEKMGTADNKDVDFADIFIGGVPGALTDTEISSVVSLDLVNLWFREPISGDSLESTMIATGIANIAGLSMATQFLRGGEAMYEGNITDGLKKMLPAFFRSWATAYVNETEGVKNRKGDTIIPQEDITGMDTMRSVLGARSNKLARWQDYYITASKNEKRIKAKKQDILDDLEDKIRSGDIKSKEAFREFWKEEVVPFNRTYPDVDFVITEDTIERSMKGRSSRSARNVQGLQVSTKSADRRLRAAEPFRP
jgi:hypothetical protein